MDYSKELSVELFKSSSQFFNIGSLNKTDKFRKIVIGENIKKAAINLPSIFHWAAASAPKS